MGELEALERLLRRRRAAPGEEHENGKQCRKQPEARNSLSLTDHSEKERPANQAGHESKPCRAVAQAWTTGTTGGSLKMSCLLGTGGCKVRKEPHSILEQFS